MECRVHVPPYASAETRVKTDEWQSDESRWQAWINVRAVWHGGGSDHTDRNARRAEQHSQRRSNRSGRDECRHAKRLPSKKLHLRDLRVRIRGILSVRVRRPLPAGDPAAPAPRAWASSPRTPWPAG